MPKIFESPDGGKTVYRRDALSAPMSRVDTITERDFMAEMREDALWGAIRRKAKSDEELTELLNRAIVYYILKYTKDE